MDDLDEFTWKGKVAYITREFTNDYDLDFDNLPVVFKLKNTWYRYMGYINNYAFCRVLEKKEAGGNG